MKKFYGLLIGLGVGLGATAQVTTYSDNFDDGTTKDFLNSSVLISGQNGSDLIIKSQGHGEWDGVGYTLNDGSNGITLSMKTSDTIYVRAKADFSGDINPVLSLQLFDSQGAGPNNDLFNAQNRMTLTGDYQVFKIAVPDWNMTYGGPTDPVGTTADTSDITRLNLAVNSAFASFPSKNSEGEDITAAFVGTVYIDYISLGTMATAGQEPNVLTSYSYTFDATSIDNITGAASLSPEIVDNALQITSAGHDEWDVINVAIPDAVVDISDSLKLSFTAKVEKASGYTGPIGIMVTAVDEVGTRIEYAGLFTVQDLSSEGESIAIEFDQYINQGDVTIQANENRIASFDILINQGFASAPFTNDAGEAVNAAFEGVLTISDITLAKNVVGLPSDLSNKKSLRLYPNPAASVVYLEGVNNGSFSITNMYGAEVASGNTQGHVNVQDLENGAYVIIFENNEEVRVAQFIKQ